jgi:6-pyruvoyltetrahydropterin/6-carboxytetrahydropterin synthase
VVTGLEPGRRTMEIAKYFTFEAAHYLPLVDELHKCSRVHGHSYGVTIGVDGPVTPQGWVVDCSTITAAMASVSGTLDHHLLNEVPGLSNPTAEMLAIWIYDHVKPSLEELSSVTIRETATARCTYRGSA